MTRPRIPRALGRHCESSRNRRILQRHCITTNHVHCTTRRVAWPRASRGPPSLHEILVGEGVNPICACACPPCWRRSNVTIRDRRRVCSASANASKGVGYWHATIIEARLKNRPEQRPMWQNRLSVHLIFIFLITISLVQQRVCRLIILLPLPFHLWFSLSFIVGCANKSIFETDDARAPSDARHRG